MSKPNGKREVTPNRGWTDRTMSDRHRTWGFHVPAVDVDFLLIEFSQEVPKALIEYKAWAGRYADLDSGSIRVVAKVATQAGLPFFVCDYSIHTWFARVHPINDKAREWIPGPRLMTEAQYVTFLYRIRGHVCPAEILLRCNTYKPQE